MLAPIDSVAEGEAAGEVVTAADVVGLVLGCTDSVADREAASEVVAAADVVGLLLAVGSIGRGVSVGVKNPSQPDASMIAASSVANAAMQ